MEASAEHLSAWHMRLFSVLAIGMASGVWKEFAACPLAQRHQPQPDFQEEDDEEEDDDEAADRKAQEQEDREAAAGLRQATAKAGGAAASSAAAPEPQDEEAENEQVATDPKDLKALRAKCKNSQRGPH